MEHSITNTLFRFVTLRAPEKSQVEDNNSTRASTPISSLFVSSLDQLTFSSERERLVALKRVTEEYKASPSYVKDKESLISLVGMDVYSFALWLKKERNNSNEEIITERARNTERLDERKITALWDNLFCYMVSKSDTSLRENIQNIIIASNLQNKIDLTEFKGKAKELSKAKFTVPDFFSRIEITEKASEKATPVNTLFKDETGLIYADYHLQHLRSLESELELVQKSYDKANAIAKKEYDESFERQTALAYERATKVEKTYIDPETGREVVYYEYENLELPEYKFKAIDESKISSYYKGTLSESLKDIQTYFWSRMHLTTIDELKMLLKEDQNKTNEILFKYAKLKTTNRVGEGGVVYRTATNGLISSNGTFNIYSVGAYNTKKLYILFNGIPHELSVNSATYKVTFPNNTFVQKTLFSQSLISTGVLQIDIFNTPGNYFDPGNTHTSFTIEATFNCSNNQQLTLSGSASINREQLVIDNPGSGQIINPGIGLYPDDTFLHNDGWNTLNFPSFAPFKVMSTTGFSFTGNSHRYNFNVFGNGNYQLVSLNVDNPGNDPGNGDNEEQPSVKYGLKRLGIADYRRVEQEVCCYVPGEVSHIENIMAREYKERTTRRLRRSEETLTSTKERETENLTDTTTTERFEMNQEIYQMTSQQNSLGVQGGIRWDSRGAGPSGFVNTDMAYSSSKDNSNTQAVNFAKDVTERALERVVSKIKEERISKIIDEFSEENIHGFDNKKGDNHISGVYRWVDKVYENRIINYGKRLMYEFAIPEPAAFHRFATNKKSSLENDLVEPKDPRIGDGEVTLKKPSDITENNYQHWAAIYNAEIEPCPDRHIFLSGSMTDNGISGNYMTGSFHVGGKNTSILDIPENYKAISYTGTFGFAFVPKGHENTSGYLFVGNDTHFLNLVRSTGNVSNDRKYISGSLPGTEKKFEVSFYGLDVGAMSLAIQVKCERKTEVYTQWQIDTFKAIITAYEEKLKDYKEKKEQLQALQKEKALVNPLFYREIENTMLRKSCMEYFLNDNQIGITGLITTEDAHNVRADYTEAALGSYADKVKFLEQAFEWDIMSYNFYPFYWAEKSKWVEYYTTECDDPTFKAFLQSGMARVIVTVRPGFEAAVNWFLETNEVWNGEEAPTINDPLFKDIVDELEVIDGKLEDTWQSRVPTSLTVIQAGSIGLDVQGLPCDVDCGDYGFDSDGNSLNPIKQTDTKIGGNDQPEE